MNENLAYKDEFRDELIGGKVVMMSPASPNHNRVVRNISGLFDRYLRGRTCEAFTDGVLVYLTEDEHFIPDVLIVCDPDKVQGDGIHGSPDLVVEVLSPSTAQNDRRHKKEVYERCGVREYWIVSPGERTVEQYLLQDKELVLHQIYADYPEWMLQRMTPEAQAAVIREFKCSLYDDLVIPIADVFARVL